MKAPRWSLRLHSIFSGRQVLLEIPIYRTLHYTLQAGKAKRANGYIRGQPKPASLLATPKNVPRFGLPVNPNNTEE